jgi:peroxiredoxin
MKKLLFLVLFLTQASLFAQDKVILKGQINNPVTDYLTLSFQNHFVTYAPKSIRIPLKKDNTFFIEIEMDTLNHAFLKHGNQVTDLFLQAWDSVHIKSEGRSFQKNMIFKGLGGTENTCLADFHQKFDKKNNPYPQEYQSLNPKNFRSFADKARKEETKFLKNYAREYTLSKEFVNYLQNKIDYTWANHLMKYPIYFEYLNQGKKQKYPNGYYDFLSEVPIQNQTALVNYEFVQFLDNYFVYLKQSLHITDPADLYDLMERRLKGSVRYHTMARSLATAIDENYFEQLKEEYKSLSRSLAFDNYHYLEAVENKLKTVRALKTSQNLPDFKLDNLRGEQIQLNTFKNKPICLIFWESDCQDCLTQSKTNNQVLQSFDEEVELIYVALDKDKDLWNDKLSVAKIEGTQLYAGESANGIIKKYDLTKLPSYFLINKEGKIIQKAIGVPNKEEIENLVLTNEK